MNPDAYIPLYGSDFFEAMKPHGEKVGWAYLKAIWHYWKHTHCKGLPNDSEQLRKICEIERVDWEAVEAILFDNDKCFAQDATTFLWHQKRAAEEWAKAVAKYNAAVESGRKGGYSKARKRREQL